MFFGNTFSLLLIQMSQHVYRTRSLALFTPLMSLFSITDLHFPLPFGQARPVK